MAVILIFEKDPSLEVDKNGLAVAWRTREHA